MPRPFPLRRTLASLGLRAVSLGLAQPAGAAEPAGKGAADLDRRTGIESAGLACFPRGVTTGRKFVADREDFAAMLKSELSELEPDEKARLPFSTAAQGEIILSAIESKLCAKGYGILGRGDTKSLSGSARFTFEWNVTDPGGSRRSGTEIIALNLGKRDALTPPGWLRLALRRLFANLAAR